MENETNKNLQLKIMVLNAQDLFLFTDKYDGTPLPEMTEIKWGLMSSSLWNNKSKEKCQMLALSIQDAEADIVMLTEVGGLESLQNFNQLLLNNQYEALSLPSNSDRGIDLGYLVKKSSEFKLDIHTHIHFPLPHPARRFSRDVLQLDVTHEGRLKMILLLVHIKSKLDLKKADFEGRTRRSHEVKGVIDIYHTLSQRGVPVLVGGDFNGLARETETEEEFRQLYELTDLKDIAHLAKIPDEDRFSYIYFNRGGNRFVQQIDYLFMAEKYASLLVPEECYFPRYKNLNGSPLPIPRRMEQKNILPSDHYPFLATLKF